MLKILFYCNMVGFLLGFFFYLFTRQSFLQVADEKVCIDCAHKTLWYLFHTFPFKFDLFSHLYIWICTLIYILFHIRGLYSFKWLKIFSKRKTPQFPSVTKMSCPNHVHFFFFPFFVMLRRKSLWCMIFFINNSYILCFYWAYR